MALLASPYTGQAYAVARPLPIDSPEVATSGEDILPGAVDGADAACAVSGLADPACLALIGAASWALAHYLPSVWHWHFGPGHQTDGVDDTAGCYSGNVSVGICMEESAFPGVGVQFHVRFIGAVTSWTATSWNVTTTTCSHDGGPNGPFDTSTWLAIRAAAWCDGTLLAITVTGHDGAGNQSTATWNSTGTYPVSPHAGAVTVTGHCYNASTLAADGTVSGSSTWTGADTTVPDTTLPACPDGDGLGAIDVQGSGSAAGFSENDDGYDPSQYPDACLAESAACTVTWQQSEGKSWVDVDASSVPTEHGNGYRCELKTGSGVEVQVVDDSLCPAPTGSDDDTSTKTQGPPSDFTLPDGTDLSSCFPNGWGLLNPIEWVEKPAICAIEYSLPKLFEPTDTTEADLQAELDAAETKAPLSYVLGFPSWISGLTGVGTQSSCPDWTVTVDGQTFGIVCSSEFIQQLHDERPVTLTLMMVTAFGGFLWSLWYAVLPVFRVGPSSRALEGYSASEWLPGELSGDPDRDYL